MHVFTYGTLMYSEVWQEVVGRRFEMIEGAAFGYAIYRVREAVFPGIVAAGAEDTVRGVVYLDVDDSSLARLDRFEDDFYQRLSLPIQCSDGQIRTADAYVVPPARRDVLTDEVWRAEEFIARGHLAEFTRRFAGFVRIEAIEDPN